MDTVEAPPKRRGIPKWLVPAIGYTVSAASLVWVFSKFPYAQLGDHLRTLNWKWAALAIAFEISVYFFDAWRWEQLLVPLHAPSFGICLQAVFVGLFANDVLPAKAGELVRCFLLSYETEIPLSLAFTSQIILRIMDGVWIVILYLMVTLQIGTHPVVRDVMWGFGITVVVIAGLSLFVLFRRQHAHHFVKTTSWAARFVHLLDEVHRLGEWRALRTAMGISGLYWLAQTLAIWALTRADAFDLGVSAAAFLLVVKAVVTLIPNAPASMGAYQAAAMYGLGLLLVEHNNAQIFAEIMFWFLTLPVAIGGALAVAFTGVDITALHKRAHDARAGRMVREAP
jgi:glycosyltransferase 2 family protein